MGTDVTGLKPSFGEQSPRQGQLYLVTKRGKKASVENGSRFLMFKSGSLVNTVGENDKKGRQITGKMESERKWKNPKGHTQEVMGLGPGGSPGPDLIC